MNTPMTKEALAESARDMICVMGNIAAFEPEDIDGDALEFRLEAEDGVEFGCTISITSQCQDAADVMQQMLDALEAKDKRIAELEEKLKPAEFDENADADSCRTFAWGHVKQLVTTDGWTLGDSCNYFGFFCWGWDMRRQFNEQRAESSKKVVKLPQRQEPTSSGHYGEGYLVPRLTGSALDYEETVAALAEAGIALQIQGGE